MAIEDGARLGQGLVDKIRKPGLAGNGYRAAEIFFAVGVSGTRALIEDLTQDTFVRVHRGLPRFVVVGPARLSTWILTIATRVALNALRRPRLRIEALGRRARAVAAEAPDAALGMIVREALDRMTPDHRAILLLREVHQLSYEEIADALEIDLGTVRSRLSRAQPPIERALRLLYRLGNDFERMLGESLTPARAHELRKHYDAWPGMHIHDAGCEEHVR